MTKVFVGWWLWWLVASWMLSGVAFAQAGAEAANCPRTAAALYARLGSVGLDAQRVRHIRAGRIDRPDLHLDFDDGTLAFTEDICGHITGAYFEGDGEVLLRPPNRVERESLAFFTGMAILEEQFTSAYLRFNDDTATELQPFLSADAESSDFANQSNDLVRGLASLDTLRLLLDFSHFLPTRPGQELSRPDFPQLLHTHLLGRKLGAFEVYWDAASAEPLWAGQARKNGDVLFFDTWTSFAPASPRGEASGARMGADVAPISFRIRTSVQPPTRVEASADVEVRILDGGERTLVLELSRYLKVSRVTNDGQPVEFIQNQALEGSQLRRKGDDLVAVVFPAPLARGQQLKLHFQYAGDVLSEAGEGLLYVGDRGTWYPNFGLSPAQFDLEFRYPSSWTLLATGKQVAPDSSAGKSSEGEKVTRWISERPIPIAGFNLGRYLGAEAKAGGVTVEAYGTRGVERSFPKAPAELVEPPNFRSGPPRPGLPTPAPIVVSPPTPSPARNVQVVADEAAKAVRSFATWFGPFPYHSLTLTQMPGNLSQGWPGLLFLSSYTFLSPQEQSDLKLDGVRRILDSQTLVHETAHQWWGDLVLWKSYRDQWLMEGLANYSSLLLLEQKDPAQFRQVLEKYRSDLLTKNKDGEWLRDAGPVTLGQRLISSHFPGGYEAISYERGTWLFHMLRSMLRDCGAETRSRNRRISPDEPFFRALRRVRERYAGKSLTTQEFLHVFEEELPRPLWYDNRRSLDWFLDGWINGKAMPMLQARDIHIVQKDQSAIASGVILQKEAPEDLVTAVPVYALTAAKSMVYIGEVLADGKETSFRLPAPRDARKIVLDPKQTILTTLK